MDEDDLARMRSEMDQAREGVREFAGTVWTFYSEAVGSGFTDDQAMALTMAFVQASVAS